MGNCLSASDVAPLCVKEVDEKPLRQKIAPDLNITFEDLQSIDNHALQTPLSAESSIQTLADYLAQPASSDVEIVRAFYIWICENIRYDTESYFGGKTASSDSSDVLRSKSSVCEGYASIFMELCKAKDIHCKKISGYAKGYGHKPGQVISYDSKTNHAWNVVFVQKKWRFIESTWGAGHIDENKKFVKMGSNFYFFTKPEDFIFDHYPYIGNDRNSSKEWQLLSKPLSLEDYSKAIKPTKEAREWAIEFSSHRNEIIEVAGSVEVILKSSRKQLKNLSVNFFNDNGTRCMSSAVIIADNKTKFRIIVKPNEIGNYVLSIFGKVDASVTTMPQLGEYFIKCKSIYIDSPGFPPYKYLYGPSNNVDERGFDWSTFPKAYQEVEDGELMLKIKTTRHLSVSASIMNEEISINDNFVLPESTAEGVLIRTRLTTVGYFKLTLFSKLDGSEKLTEAFNFLIYNKRSSDIHEPFPKVFQCTSKFHCHLIAPLSQSLSSDEITFKMSSPFVTSVMIKTSSGKKKTYPKEEREIWDIKLNPTESGPLHIYAKTEDCDTSYQGIYEYVIK